MPAVVGLVLKADIDRLRASRQALSLGLEEQPFRDVKGEVDWIDGVDGGEERSGTSSTTCDLAAGIDAPIGDFAAYRGAHAGEFKVEAPLCNERVVCSDIGMRRFRGRAEIVNFFPRHGLVRNEAKRASKFGIRERCSGPRCRSPSLSFGKCGCKRPWVDREEQLPRMHKLAVFEMECFELARDARADLDRSTWLEPASQFVIFDDPAL